MPLHYFGSKSTITLYGERFRDGQYSLVSFLFAVLLLTVPPAPSHFNKEHMCPRALRSRRHFPHIDFAFVDFVMTRYYSHVKISDTMMTNIFITDGIKKDKNWVQTSNRVIFLGI